MTKRILLLYISNVSGHRQASVAIEEALRLADPDVQIRDVNCVNYTNPIMERVVNSTYMNIVKRTPELWEYLYDNPRVMRRTAKLRRFIHRYNSRKLKKLLDEFDPHVVVCTQAFPCGLVADYKKTYRPDLPLVGVLTDYAPHSYWIYENVTAYVVPAEETGERMVQNGVPAEKIYSYGIPIRPHFLSLNERDFVCSQLGLDPAMPTVLIMGGGQGLGPIARLVTEFFRVRTPMQIVVVTGTNKRLYRKLARKRKKPGKRLVVYGFTDLMPQLMDIASLIISKPGGVTTAEVLAKRLPLVIIDPLPGQESMNTEYLLGKGVAVKAADIFDAVELSDTLLRSPERLSAYRQAARLIAKPDAALKTAQLVLNLA